MITIGIVGGSGYVAGELIRCLLLHPNAQIDFIFSHSNAGNNISQVHHDLYGCNMKFTSVVNPNVDVVFLSLGHGNSLKFLSEHQFSEETKIIDLSSDFRLKDSQPIGFKKFVYGLSELNNLAVSKAQNVANPGCFATAIQLGLIPAVKAGKVKKEVHIHALTGSTGAGKSLSNTSHFSWRNNNVSAYKVFDHQHLLEINETIYNCNDNKQININFIPIRGPFPRGIFATIYWDSVVTEKELLALYKDFYEQSPFVFITNSPVNLKQVINTNNALIQVEVRDNKALITVAIDNLLKGAAGQAIQNMNSMFGLPDASGLLFKSSAF